MKINCDFRQEKKAEKTAAFCCGFFRIGLKI